MITLVFVIRVQAMITLALATWAQAMITLALVIRNRVRARNQDPRWRRPGRAPGLGAVEASPCRADGSDGFVGGLGHHAGEPCPR
jgi:hypothetical protein